MVIFYYQLFSQTFITVTNNLNFGDVFIGYNKTVTDLDPLAGRFQFYHTDGRRENVRITFGLPSTLTNGINSVPIIFSQSYSSYGYANSTTGRIYFNPYNPLIIKNLRRNRIVYFWLGGTIQSSNNIIPGIYSGTIQITVEILP